MKLELLFVLLFSIGSSAFAQESRYITLGTHRIHHAAFSPIAPVGDVLYLHGYGDSFLNHQSLFKSFNQRGLRVIAFDYPSHGLTDGVSADDLDHHSFGTLTKIASLVLKQHRSDDSKPLIIAGWSTGGLHAARIAQKPEWRKLFPGLSGLILYAPGVSVRTCVGNRICHISNETLTHDANLGSREIRPSSPLYRLNFAAKLMVNSWISWRQALPSNVPALVIIASDGDRYVQSPEIEKWIQLQRREFKANIIGIQCRTALHEVDNELEEHGGPFVREQSGVFAESIVRQVPFLVNGTHSSCEPL